MFLEEEGNLEDFDFNEVQNFFQETFNSSTSIYNGENYINFSKYKFKK